MKSLPQLPPRRARPGRSEPLADPAGGAHPGAAAGNEASGCGTGADGAPVCCAPEEPRLIAQGWTRRFVGDARMTEESTALYSRLGWEVIAIPLGGAAVGDQCAGCADTLRGFSVLYTRRPPV